MADNPLHLEYRPLGRRTGIEVCPIGTGLWAVGGSAWGPADDQATLAAIDVALDLGCCFFDTADVYGGGHSETLLGRAMKGRREQFVVATKIGWMGFDEARGRSQYESPEVLMTGVEASLRRLDTDYVDVLFCHIDRPEPNTPHFIEAFRRLKEAGRVRAWGVSTSNVEHLRTFNQNGDCDVLQIDYSILNRSAEQDALPYCLEHGIGVVIRGPLAMGLLCGKFDQQTSFPEGDFRRSWLEEGEQFDQYRRDLRTVERLKAIVPDHQTLAQFSLRFAHHHPAVSVIIPGARNEKQARSNCRVAKMPALSTEELTAIGAIVSPGNGRKIWPA